MNEVNNNMQQDFNQNNGINQVPNQPSNNNKKSNNVLIICITSIILVLIVGAIVIFLNNKPKSNESSENENNTPKTEETTNNIDNQTTDNNNTSNEFVGKYVASSSDSSDTEYFVLNSDGTANIHYITGDGRKPYNDIKVKYSIVKENGKTVLKFDTTNLYWNTLDGEKTDSEYKFIPREVGPSSSDLMFTKINISGEYKKNKNTVCPFENIYLKSDGTAYYEYADCMYAEFTYGKYLYKDNLVIYYPEYYLEFDENKKYYEQKLSSQYSCEECEPLKFEINDNYQLKKVDD